MNFRNIPPFLVVIIFCAVLVGGVFGVIVYVGLQDLREPTATKEIPLAKTQVSAVEKAANWPDATLPVSDRGDVYVTYTDNIQEPRILEVALDPLYPKIGEEQTITVKTVEKGTKVTRDNVAMAKVQTDNGTETINLKLRKIEEPDLTITWQGSWIVEDTHDTTYAVKINVSNVDNTNSVTLSLQ